MSKFPTQVQHVAVSLADGSVAVLQFLTLGRSETLPSGASWFGSGVWARPANAANVEAEVRKTFGNEGRIGKQMPGVTGWRLMQAGDVPQDRTYRDAWKDEGLKIGHDMARAREIHRDKLRRAREPLLAQLDTEYLRADEASDQQKKRDIAREKQRLRDVTADPRIEAATTIEDLKAVTL